MWPRAGKKIQRRSSVICDDPDDLSVCIEFHELARLRAFMVHVVKNDAGNSPHHIQKFEGEIWIRLKPSLEITPQSFFACNGPGRLAQ